MVIQHIAKANSAIAFGYVAAEHAVKEAVTIRTSDFKPVKAVNLAQANVFLNVFDFCANDVEGFVEIE